jgi:phosphomannomutase
MTLMLSVSGCRGIVGQTLTPEVAARFAGSYATFLAARADGKPVSVVLGRDGRAGGHMLHAAATSGLIASGANVIDVGIAMTPTVAIATDAFAREHPNDVVAGMVLTASHNPQQWNGLKCLLPEGGEFGASAAAPRAVLAEQIIARFKNAGAGFATWERLGEVSDRTDADEGHIQRLFTALEDGGFGDPETLGEGLSIGIDSVNASGVRGAALAMEAMGVAELLHLGAEETGIFPHPPEPTEDNLNVPGGLCECVREQGLDVGFAQDPDADRLAIIDETGRYIGEEYTLALGALAILSAHKQAGRPTHDAVFVTNLSTSRMLDDVCASFGARVIRTPVGEANVVEVMKRERAMAGGEGNGGVIWPRMTYVRDSISAMALVMWLLSGRSGERRKLSEIVGSLHSYSIRKRKVDLARREDANPAVEKIAKAFAGNHVDLSDGAWVNLESRRSWLHVRASNTEPIMRLIAEAPTQAEADALLDEAARVIG